MIARECTAVRARYAPPPAELRPPVFTAIGTFFHGYGGNSDAGTRIAVSVGQLVQREDTAGFMARWRFYQGLRTEWRWYQFDEAGQVVAESDRGFAELQGCMANAEESAGFTGDAYQVHARQAVFADAAGGSHAPKPAVAAALTDERPDQQALP